MTTRRYFASCPKGLESLLADEARTLGAASVRETVAGVAIEADAHFAWRALLWSRLASRLLLPIAELAADDADQLYAGARDVDWSVHFSAEDTFAIDAIGTSGALRHTEFTGQKIKDAVVDRFRDETGARPSVDATDPAVRIHAHLKRGRATLSIDIAGRPLNQRGWRVQQGLAPLKENLAVAMLLRARWPEIHRAGGALVDPFCGAGSLLIEGALMAADVAPGLKRDAAKLARWRGFDAVAYEAERTRAEARAAEGLRGLEPIFFGSDADPHAVNSAKVNAQRAGVAGFISLKTAEVGRLIALPSTAPGLVIGNPPYGERLGEVEALKPVYADFGRVLKQHFAGWRAALITSSIELGHATGLKAERRYALKNGALDCQLLCFDEVRASDAPPKRMPKPLGKGAEALANRLEKNLKHLSKRMAREGAGAWRVYDADLPEYASAIDIYDALPDGDDDATPPERWLHVQEYQAPKEIPADVVETRLRETLRVAREVLDVPRERIALKTRRPQTRESRYTRHDARGEFLTVREGRLRFRVNLFDYLDTGLFLDHRPMRARIGAAACDKRFLNLFAYTGAATVHAAAGGARSSVSVDLSRTYLEWADRNLADNGLAHSAHRLVQSDALSFLEADASEYDLIFIDPPTFSNSKRADDFDVGRDHARLIELAFQRLAADGMVLFSTNARRFKIDPEVTERWQVGDITRQTIPADFARDQRIHHAFELARR